MFVGLFVARRCWSQGNSVVMIKFKSLKLCISFNLFKIIKNQMCLRNLLILSILIDEKGVVDLGVIFTESSKCSHHRVFPEKGR